MIEQVIYNILVASARYFMVAAGLFIIFRAIRFFDLGLGALFTFCAYLTMTFAKYWRLPFVLSVVLSLFVIALISACLYKFVYVRLWQKHASQLVFLLASFGVYVSIVNIISILWGESTITMKSALVGSIELNGLRITSDQIATILGALFVWFTLHILLSYTRWGKGLRAFGDDAELAEVCGVYSETVLMIAYIVGAFLVGLSGVSVAVGINLIPGMGINALLNGVVVLILGGGKRLTGIAIGAVFLASAQNLVTWYTGPQWQDPLAFILLVGFLIIKPEDILGRIYNKTSV